MVVQSEDKLGVARDHRWMKLAEQKRQLEADGCRAVLELTNDPHKGGHTVDDLYKLARPGRLFTLVHIFLLAEPRAKRLKGGMKANLLKVLDEIAKRGGVVKDMETGLTTATKEHRKAIVAVAHSHISRSNRGLRSALNGHKSRGRPKSWTDPAVRQVLWDAWHSDEYRTNAAAVAAAATKLGRKVYIATMYKVVKEMRAEKGIPDTGGASGRLPGNPTMREHPRRKQRRVYFARSGNKVKIGVATKVNGRISTIQSGSPAKIELLACIPGGPQMERKMHARFAKLRIRGEWFRYKGELMEYVQSLPKCRG